MRTTLLAAPFALVAFAAPIACSSTDTSEAHAALAACAWPASLDSPDGGAWTVGRTLLQCKDGNATAICVSDNLTTCPGSNPIQGGAYTDCVDQCESDEYAVASGGPPILEPDGGIGWRPQPVLPAACHSAGNTPGGVSFACCPCQ
jgi:hypothetical protein